MVPTIVNRCGSRGDSVLRLERFTRFFSQTNSRKSPRIIAEETARLLNELAEKLKLRSYLEIGVEAGFTFRRIKIDSRVAVDPNFLFDYSLLESNTVHFYEVESDTFFRELDASTRYDLVFIDGLHTYEQVKKDLLNTLKHATKESIVVIDDTVPIDKFSSLPSQEECYRLRKLSGFPDDGSWHGDVFKLVHSLSLIRDNGLRIATLVDLVNPKTVVWRESGDWLRIAKEIKDTQVSYEELFKYGIPDSFNPISSKELLRELLLSRHT